MVKRKLFKHFYFYAISWHKTIKSILTLHNTIQSNYIQIFTFFTPLSYLTAIHITLNNIASSKTHFSLFFFCYYGVALLISYGINYLLTIVVCPANSPDQMVVLQWWTVWKTLMTNDDERQNDSSDTDRYTGDNENNADEQAMNRRPMDCNYDQLQTHHY